MRVVVIGAGIMGLSIAYNLAKNGAEVIVLEARYPGSGLSTRAIGGVHSQWDNEQDVRLAMRSRESLAKLSTELDFNVPFRRDGLLTIASREEEFNEIKKNVALQRSFGLDSMVLSQEEVGSRYPILDTSSVVGGAFSKGDGVVHPFSVVFGYWYGFEQLRGRLLKNTQAKSLLCKGNLVQCAESTAGAFEADAFVVAAGVGSNKLLRTVGLSVPTEYVRHEMLATESLKFFLKPMVNLHSKNAYINQSLRGEIICDIARSDNPSLPENRSSLAFLEDAATMLTQLIPATSEVKVLREWAGVVETTTRSSPVCGKIGFDNLWIAFADSGKGVMFAHSLGEIIAKSVVTGQEEPSLLHYSPDEPWLSIRN